MNFLPDTNACISLLRRRTPSLMVRWQSTRAADIVLCSVVVYELRHGAERSSNPAREHAKLDVFLETFVSLPFDDACAHRCAQIRAQLERDGAEPGLRFCEKRKLRKLAEKIESQHWHNAVIENRRIAGLIPTLPTS